MMLIEVTQTEAWEEFVAAQPFAQYPQSWIWGEFGQSQGKEVRRFALTKGGAWQAAIQLERRMRRFGMGYWFAPRGPVFSSAIPKDQRPQVMMKLCELLVERKELRRKTLFWRFEPMSDLADPEGLVPLSFQRTGSLNPASTITLDLTQSEEQLLAKMHEKTRYNIRVAHKHGVVVRTASSVGDMDIFLRLMDETAARDGFVQHSSKYLVDTFRFLEARGMATIRIAEHDKVPLAAQMEITYGDTTTYLYGASSSESRKFMAPYALHWSAITDAKKRGFSLYDFWGANPEFQGAYYYKASWDGITRFKRGFGGDQRDLVGTWDLPFNRVIYSLVFLNQFFRG